MINNLRAQILLDILITLDRIGINRREERMKAKRNLKASPNPIQRIVFAYRQELGGYSRPLSFAKFAMGLNDAVSPLGLSISYQSIKNWEDGIYRPDYAFIMQLSIHAPAGSWQRSFAIDLLATQFPGLYQPSSEIGKPNFEQVYK